MGYNCPSKVPVISNPEPCNSQTIDELPQKLPIFHPTFHSEAESPFTLDSTPTYERFDSLDDNIISGLPPFSAITPDEPVLSTEEPDNSLSMGDEHLDTIPATKSDEFIKSGVENLIPIPSKSEGIPEHVCDVPSHDNSLPLDASPPDSELVSFEVMEIVIPKVGGIDDDILLTIKDDILQYDCFRFKVEPNSRNFTKDVVEDIFPTKEPQVLNTLPTHPTLQLNMKFQPSSESLFAYVVWIFLPFL
nr:hypothetical protein [Tanacetum cinerariifolium]